MWHKAPCSSRDYSGVRESGPRKRDEDGDDDDLFEMHLLLLVLSYGALCVAQA